jgi:hypothetical protein
VDIKIDPETRVTAIFLIAAVIAIRSRSFDRDQLIADSAIKF